MNLVRSVFTPPSHRSGQVLQRGTKVGPAATTQYSGVGRPMLNDWDAGLAIREAYLMNVVIYRCVQLNAEKLASLPFRAGKALPENPGDKADHNPDAPLAQLLGPPPGGPNPDVSPRQLWAHACAQYQTTGRFGWELAYSNNKVSSIWPLIAQYLRPIQTANGNGTAYFEGYEYYNQGKRINYTADEVYYDWKPSQYDWHQAESPLQAARLDAAVAIMQDLYDRAFLINDARPASVVVHQAFAEREENDAFKEQFNSSYGGPTNAGKAIFVPAEDMDGSVAGAIDIKTLGISQRDSDAIKRYEQKIRSIAAAFGVPFSKIDSSNRTFSNASEENDTWEAETIVPLALSFQDSVNIRLAPKLGKEVGWFDLSGLGIFREKQIYVQVSPIDAYDDNLITWNEARAAMGEDPIDGDGDKLKKEIDPPQPVPPALANAQTVDQPTDPAADPAQPGPAESTDPPVSPERVDPGVGRDSGGQHSVPARTQPQTVTKALPKPERAPEPAAPAETAASREAQWRKLDKQIASLESPWVQSFQSLFDRQEKACLARLNGKRGRQAFKRAEGEDPQPSPDVNTIFDEAFWRNETATTAIPLYTTVAIAAINRASETFDYDFPTDTPFVEVFIRQRANQLAGLVTDTTYEAIKDQLVEGVSQGESIDKLAKRIQNVFADASKNRATVIARTETVGSWNGATWITGANAPNDVVAGMEWLSSHDSRVRSSHRAADGQVVGTGQRFNVGGYSMSFPGDGSSAPPSEVVNCVPGWAQISGNLTGAVMRRVDCVLIDLVTTDGHKLTATPNHPVLTRSGWRPLGTLKPGDDVFRAAESRTAAGGTNPNVNKSEPTAEEAFSSVTQRASRRERVPTTLVDLDGEMIDDYVDVELTDLVLPLGVYAEQLEKLGHLSVEDATAPGRKVRIADHSSSLLRVTHSDEGGLSRRSDWQIQTIEPGDHSSSRYAQLVSHGVDRDSVMPHPVDVIQESQLPGTALDVLDVAASTQRHVRIEKGAFDGLRTNAESFSDDLDRQQFLGVEAHDLVSVPTPAVFGGSSSSDSQLIETCSNHKIANTELDSKGSGTLAIDVPLANVISDRVSSALVSEVDGVLVSSVVSQVTERSYSGSVYDFSASEGLYLADGFVVHNCRCSTALLTPAEYDLRKTRTAAQYRLVEQVEAELLRMAAGTAHERIHS